MRVLQIERWTTSTCRCLTRYHSNCSDVSEAAAVVMGGSGSKQKLSKEDLDFLMENTNFTKKQIKAWYSGFMVTFSLLTSTLLSVYQVYILYSSRIRGFQF